MKINYFQSGGSTPYRTAHPESVYNVSPETEILYNVIGPLSQRTIMDQAVALRSKAMNAPRTVDDDIVSKVIKGQFGNGQARIDALTKLGYNAKDVQAAVNAKLKPQVAKPAPTQDKSLDLMIQAGEKLAANKLQRQTSNLFSGIQSGVTTQNQYPAMLQWQRANDQAAMQSDMATNPQNYFGTDQASANALKMQSLNNIEKTLPVAQNSVPQTAVAQANPESKKPISVWQSMAKPLPPMSTAYGHGWYKEGGKINYFQAGGQMQQDPIAEVISGLIQNPQQTIQALSQSKDANAIVQEIVKRAKAGDQQAAQAVQVLQQIMQQQQAPAAKNGAKLDYFRRLRGKCPQGEEMVYMKNGGCMCQKKVDGGKQETPQKKQFFTKKPLDKCGGKMKKKK